MGGETRTVGAGGTAVAPAGEIHGARNESAARTVLLVVMAPHPNCKEK